MEIHEPMMQGWASREITTERENFRRQKVQHPWMVRRSADGKLNEKQIQITC